MVHLRRVLIIMSLPCSGAVPNRAPAGAVCFQAFGSTSSRWSPSSQTSTTAAAGSNTNSSLQLFQYIAADSLCQNQSKLILQQLMLSVPHHSLATTNCVFEPRLLLYPSLTQHHPPPSQLPLVHATLWSRPGVWRCPPITDMHKSHLPGLVNPVKKSDYFL